MENFPSGERLERKSKTGDDRCTPRSGLLGCTESVISCMTIGSLQAAHGEPRQPLKSKPMAERWRTTATQWAFHCVSKIASTAEQGNCRGPMASGCLSVG